MIVAGLTRRMAALKLEYDTIHRYGYILGLTFFGFATIAAALAIPALRTRWRPVVASPRSSAGMRGLRLPNFGDSRHDLPGRDRDREGGRPLHEARPAWSAFLPSSFRTAKWGST